MRVVERDRDFLLRVLSILDDLDRGSADLIDAPRLEDMVPGSATGSVGTYVALPRSSQGMAARTEERSVCAVVGREDGTFDAVLLHEGSPGRRLPRVALVARLGIVDGALATVTEPIFVRRCETGLRVRDVDGDAATGSGILVEAAARTMVAWALEDRARDPDARPN